MSEETETIIDWAGFSSARSELGADFVRILGYFREDGVKSVAAIEEAMRASNAIAMVLPAHTLKGEASQFGAEALADLAEKIENIARQSIEWRQAPDEALPDVVRLRALFDDTLIAFERETNPLMERRGFGRKIEAANQRFGQL
ncbi:Hpt domain-containing protein [Sphingomonas sp.]|uniref:Hpt domain-containing protein n=1 Tax=Sphingomonas sp. TaxID=28214 RepID=UPI0025F89B09|nr:Hpt domain-containing protein [Sphingomonas sp.]